jgi:hypothetical protein
MLKEPMLQAHILQAAIRDAKLAKLILFSCLQPY